jgi:hypothetical protein
LAGPVVVNQAAAATAFYKGNNGSLEYMEWYKYEFWRFVLVQQKVEELAKSAIDFPPMQKGGNRG